MSFGTGGMCKELVGLEIPTAVTVKRTGFRVVTPCSSERVRQAELSFLPTSSGFFFGLLFDPEGGSDMFLRNFRPTSNFMALQHRRLYSSKLILILYVNYKSYFTLLASIFSDRDACLA